MKPAKVRPLAEQDLVDVAYHYAQEGGMALGERMFDAAVAALKSIQRMPAMGSPRLGQQCEISGLRSWRVKGFPMQWLYFEGDDHLDVIRLLGDRQDIAAILSATTELGDGGSRRRCAASTDRPAGRERAEHAFPHRIAHR